MEFLYEYGLFLLKAITIVIAIVLVIGMSVSMSVKHKGAGRGELEISHLSEKLQEAEMLARSLISSKDEFKEWKKQQKHLDKEKSKSESPSKLFVVDFKGSMAANEVEGLREEISTIVTLAGEKDEVLVRLESPGGVVHGYGLAASQLQRLRDHNIPFTACVDKVAASGGYLMACVANKIVAAPFAIIGSIGVLAQTPNFHRLLKKNNIDFEMHTAGEYKRTITMFGENSDEGREKFKQELQQVHDLFKGFVDEHRENLDIAKVATGEYWHAKQAIEMGLVDELGTSDDILLAAAKDKDVFLVKFKEKRSVAEKIAGTISLTAQSILSSLWEKQQTKF